jgi:argininosuccinate synthase
VGALYEGKYPLATALARPLIAKELVRVAQREGAEAIAHGCTGKGNDQVRFDLTAQALDPNLLILAPLREWQFKSREEEMEYAQSHGISVATTKKSPYSLDRNLWGISIECGALEDPWQEPPRDSYQITTDPEEAPSSPEDLVIEFEHGCPVKINNQRYELLSELIQTLNETGGRHGVGRIDLVENRLVGIKSREIYEAPAATILHQAYSALESLVQDRDVQHFKPILSERYAKLVYDGLWYSPLRRAIDHFMTSTQQWISGSVRVKLFKGNCVVTGRTSPWSLYRTELATYSDKDMFDQEAAKGFINLWGLPLATMARVRKEQ